MIDFDEILEPLRDLFKDEVREVGTQLGIPHALVWRQPFPGPGLAVRVIGEITWEKLEVLREADAIFREELEKAGAVSNSILLCLPMCAAWASWVMPAPTDGPLPCGQ